MASPLGLCHTDAENEHLHGKVGGYTLLSSCHQPRTASRRECAHGLISGYKVHDLYEQDLPKRTLVQLGMCVHVRCRNLRKST